jgi:hypothetical protein
MKLTWMLLLIVLSLCTCKKDDKTITPENYDGEYPYDKNTGKAIPTYQPIFTSSWQGPPLTTTATPVPASGQYSFQFRDHAWNHWPYINVSLRLVSNPSAPFDRIGSRILGVGITAMSGYECGMESVNFIIPAKAGRYRFGQDVTYDSNKPVFYNYDCDAPKDKIVADKTADNWVNVTRLDTLAKQVEGSFDLNFTIVSKDARYSLVYPTRIRIRGSFNGPFTSL